ncbi:MAG: YIP1 family protein [Bryobacteraceae bacterium]
MTEHVSDNTFGLFTHRVIGAAKLDAQVYEDVEADASALWQSLAVVVLSGMAAGIGIVGFVGPLKTLSLALGAILGWLFWAGLVFAIGNWLLPTTETRADWGQLLRTTGFATAPGLIGILGLAPPLTGFITVIANIWILAAFVVAVRQALDYTSTWRALGVCLIGWFVYGGLMLLLL